MSIMCPDNAPPRLLRLVSGADFPYPDIVSMLDYEHNVLRVRKSFWDESSKAVQEQILRTEALTLSCDHLPQSILLTE